MLINFFIKKHECTHSKVPIDVDEAYCPDCGELIRNRWYLLRCCCCDIKRSGHFEYNKIKPDTKYCPNCGCTDFYVTELDKINFVDINYAVYKKIIVPQGNYTTRQVWVEKEDNLLEEKKLIAYNY